MPKLDLGDLGVAIESAIRDEPGIVADGDHAPDAVAAVVDSTDDPGAKQAGDDPSGPEGDLAADAGDDDFEARFAERYKERYRVDVQEDIRKLQKRLDPQIAEAKRLAAHRGEDLEEAAAYAARLEQELREYDPDFVSRLGAARKSYVAGQSRERDLRQREQEVRSRVRDTWYADTFGGRIDARDPELLAAFEAGNRDLEEKLVNLKYRELRLEEVPTAESPATPAPAARNEKGQFVSPEAQRRAAETTRREQSRGPQPLASGGNPVVEAPPKGASAEQLLQYSRSQMQRGLASLGLGQG